MSNPSMLDQDRPLDPKSSTTNEPDESFGDILSEYEQSHTHRIREEGKRGLEGTVVAVTGEAVFLDGVQDDAATVDVVAPRLHAALDRDENVIVEGTQGFGLSLFHGAGYPYLT